MFENIIELCGLAAERTIRSQLAVRFNILCLLYSAQERGQQATFWTFTYKQLGEVAEMAADWSVFLRRLRKKIPGLAGVRVFERGKLKGRFHVHAVLDREVDGYLIQECKAGTRLGWAEPRRVKDGNLARYLYKELVKQLHRRDLMGRRWACFGKLPGHPWITASSLDLGLPWKFHQWRAFLSRPVGESRSETMLQGFKDWINTEIEPGLAVIIDGVLMVTDVFCTMPDAPTCAVKAPVTVELVPFDEEIAACLADDHPDRHCGDLLVYTFPNPLQSKDSVPLPKKKPPE
jgi:hypothetical protein